MHPVVLDLTSFIPFPSEKIKYSSQVKVEIHLGHHTPGEFSVSILST